MNGSTEGGRGQFRVLGPLEAELDAEPLPLGGPKHRAVLALLLLHRNRTVSASTIGDAVWGDDRPTAYQASLHVAVSGLRRTLRGVAEAGGGRLETVPSGYRLTLPGDWLDVEVFRLTRDAAVRSFRTGEPGRSATLGREALRLWRGRPLDDLSRFGFADEFAVAMDEERLATLQIVLDAELLLGRHDAVVGELIDLTRQHPLREHFSAQLATAYYHLGRQAEALNCLRVLREALDTELGIDPSPALQELEVSILRQEVRVESATRERGLELIETLAETDVATYGWLTTPWGSSHPLTARGLQIGRSPENDIALTEHRVSRQHAVIGADESGLTLTDLRSTNGTQLNGKRLAPGDHELRVDDVIVIGGSVFIVRAP